LAVIAAISLPAPLLGAEETKPPAAVPREMPAKPSGPATATSAPARPPSKARSTDLPPAVAEPLKKAMAKLQQEMQSGERRIRSDYFSENPASALTPEMVFGLLERRLDSAAAADAYFKWQLLSALPRSLSPELGSRVPALLRAAPRPEPLPGLITSDAQVRQMESQLRGYGEQDAAALLKELEAARDQARRRNDTIVSYRDGLLMIAPETFDTAVAALDDLMVRAGAGDVGKAAEAAARHASRWLSSKPPPREVRRFSSVLDEIEASPMPQMVRSFRWDNRQRGLRVVASPVGLGKTGLSSLRDEIDRALHEGPAVAPADDKGRRRR
jgi:hypothetical protein